MLLFILIKFEERGDIVPNIKSAIKRMHTSKKRYEKNIAQKSELKTQIKKTLKAIKEKDVTLAEQLLKVSCSLIDKCSKNNIMHKKTASRKKAGLASKVYKLSAGKTTAAVKKTTKKTKEKPVVEPKTEIKEDISENTEE
jgi:small subunit ribosomal protein S20